MNAHSLKYFCAVFMMAMLVTASCSKKNPEDLIVGPWRIDGGDTIYTFRQNHGWILLKINDTSQAGAKDEGKVEGQWRIDQLEGKKKFLVIIPSETVEDTPWKKERPVEFELVDISLKELVLKRSNGDVEKWKKQGKYSEEEKPVVAGVVTLPLGPQVINLKRDKETEPFRFFCIKIDLILKNGDGLDYVTHLVSAENGKESYHVHPRIFDVTQMYFGSLHYKDVKSLDRVKVAVDQYKEVLKPYFKGKLMDVGVSKVLVTTKFQSAMDFKKDEPGAEAEAEAEEKPAEEGGGHGGGHGKETENPEDAGHGEKEGAGEGEKTVSEPDHGKDAHGQTHEPAKEPEHGSH